MQIELRTLGTIDLFTDDGLAVQSVVAQPKRLAALVYLALWPCRGATYAATP